MTAMQKYDACPLDGGDEHQLAVCGSRCGLIVEPPIIIELRDRNAVCPSVTSFPASQTLFQPTLRMVSVAARVIDRNSACIV